MAGTMKEPVLALKAGLLLTLLLLIIAPSAFPVPEASEFSPFGISQAAEDAGRISEDNLKIKYVKEVGAQWKKGLLSWKKFEKRNHYLDDAVTKYYQAGIRQILEIDSTPFCILPSQNQTWCNLYGKLRTLDEYYAFVKKAVERYDGDGYNDAVGSPVVKYWQIEDPPNSPVKFWHNSKSSSIVGPAAEFALLLETAYNATKAADPTATLLVMIGAASSDTTGLSYLQELVNAGATQFYDVQFLSLYRGFWRSANETVQQASSMTGKPIWIVTSEIGGVVTRNATYSEAYQAAEVVKRYAYLMSIGVEKIFWFPLRDNGTPDAFDGNTQYADLGGLTKRDYTLKQSFFAYRLTVEKLIGYTPAGVTKITSRVMAAKFTSESSNVYVIWQPSFDGDPTGNYTATIDLSLLGETCANFTITYLSGYSQTVANPSTLIVSQTPVFVKT